MQMCWQRVQTDSNGHLNASDGRNRGFGKDPENKSLQDSGPHILHGSTNSQKVPCCRNERSVHQASCLCQTEANSR